MFSISSGLEYWNTGTFFHTGLGLGFLEEDLDLRIVDLDLAVAGLVTSLLGADRRRDRKLNSCWVEVVHTARMIIDITCFI